MAYAGGIRLAIIKDSFYRMIQESLNDLGWFVSNPGVRADVTLVSEQIDGMTEVKPNKIGISTEDLTDQEIELGSNLAENSWDLYIDVFAENDDVGTQLAGDIFDILRGKLPSIGRSSRFFPAYDYVDDSIIFNCEILDPEINRVRNWDRKYNQYWWVVYCKVVDTYYDDSE